MKKLLVMVFVLLVGAADAKAQSNALQLATINCGCKVTESDAQVARFRSLLQQLTTKWGETEKRIGDMSLTARSVLRTKGMPESLLDIMEGMNRVLDRPMPKQKYDEYLAAYLVLREEGVGHAKAMSTLRGLLQ